MATLRIKCGAIEMTATGGADFIAQERGAFNEYLKHKMGEDLLAAQRRREQAQRPAATLEGGLWRYRRIAGGHISPARLKAVKAENKLHELINPFDEIDIPLGTVGTVTAVCGHVDGNRARFVLKDCWDEHVMNGENTNKTGYHGSAGRKHVLENIWPRLPNELREIITPRGMVETIGGKEVEYEDPLWLPSATDVFGSPDWKWWPDEPDSFQLPIFQKERDRVKELGDKGTCAWWLRSVYATITASFCRVYASGTASNDYAYGSFGFAPGFDI